MKCFHQVVLRLGLSGYVEIKAEMLWVIRMEEFPSFSYTFSYKIVIGCVNPPYYVEVTRDVNNMFLNICDLNKNTK